MASLSSHYFSALGIIWRQIRAAGIGSQTRPIMSNRALAMVDLAWQHVFQTMNSDPDLYRHPVEVEPVGGSLCPWELFSFYAPASSNFVTLRLLGFRLRLSGLKKAALT